MWRSNGLPGNGQGNEWVAAIRMMVRRLRPSPTGKTPASSFHRKSGGISRSGGELLKRPTGGLRRLAWPRTLFLFLGPERHIRLVERQRKPEAASLDVGLLARPAVKERLMPRFGRERAQHCSLRRGEEPTGDFHGGEIGADALEIDTDFPTTREGVEAGAVGVGEIEANRSLTAFSEEGGFPIGAILKRQSCRFAIDVAAEKGPEDAAGSDEVPSIPLENKPRRARQLIG